MRPSCLLLVLMLATRSVVASVEKLSQLNPWLDACDLEHTADLKGVCSAASSFPSTRDDGSDDYAQRRRQYDHAAMTCTGRLNGEITGGPGPPPPPTTDDARQQQRQDDECERWCATMTVDANATTNRQQFSTGATSTQCLCYLEESHKSSVCRSPARLQLLRTLRLPQCCHRTAASALSASRRRRVAAGGDACAAAVAELLGAGDLVRQLRCKFGQLLRRYDCTQPYSVRHTCRHCQEAYRQWVCATLFPYFDAGGRRVRPCRSVCQQVEQKCPFFLPGDRDPGVPTQYAGEPTFLCLDANIPETGEQLAKTAYGDAAGHCCYESADGERLATQPCRHEEAAPPAAGSCPRQEGRNASEPCYATVPAAGRAPPLPPPLLLLLAALLLH